MICTCSQTVVKSGCQEKSKTSRQESKLRFDSNVVLRYTITFQKPLHYFFLEKKKIIPEKMPI